MYVYVYVYKFGFSFAASWIWWKYLGVTKRARLCVLIFGTRIFENPQIFLFLFFIIVELGFYNFEFPQIWNLSFFFFLTFHVLIRLLFGFEMATETLDEKTPEVNSPAKEEIDVVPKEEKEVEKEKVDSPRIGEAEEEKKEDEEEGEAKEGELGEKDKEDDVESEEEEEEEEGSGSKKSSEKETVTPTSERPTRERKKVERFSLSTPMRAPPSKSVSIEKVAWWNFCLSFLFVFMRIGSISYGFLL